MLSPESGLLVQRLQCLSRVQVYYLHLIRVRMLKQTPSENSLCCSCQFVGSSAGGVLYPGNGLLAKKSVCLLSCMV